jgi:hypothetical protein
LNHGRIRHGRHELGFGRQAGIEELAPASWARHIEADATADARSRNRDGFVVDARGANWKFSSHLMRLAKGANLY